MAQLQTTFDANTVDPTQGGGSLPVGKHKVIFNASEIKTSGSGNGAYLEYTMEIIDGPMKGMTGRYMLNLYYENASDADKTKTVRDIAHKQLSALCHVTGVFVVQDTSQLHGIPFIVEMKPQKNKPEFTEVKAVFDINGNKPGQQNSAPAQPATAQAENNTAWGNPPAEQSAAPQNEPQQEAPAQPWAQQQQAQPQANAPWAQQ